MKKIFAIEAALACFLIVAVNTPGVLVDAFSDSQIIHPNCYGGFPLCELQAGDRIDVSFSISNLGPYNVAFPDSSTLTPQQVYYSVNISLGLGREYLLNFPNTRGDSFSYTALKHGYYAIDYYCEEGPRWVDAKNPVITVNYNITEAPKASLKHA